MAKKVATTVNDKSFQARVEEELEARIQCMNEDIESMAKSGRFREAHELQIKRNALKSFLEIIPELNETEEA